MRTSVFALLCLTFSLSASCETTRLSRIHPGMTRTDVAIELGKPLEVKVDNDAIFWIYPASETQICTIKFIDQKVAQDPMKCDSSENSKEWITQGVKYLPLMNSEIEYQARVQRYCGLKPLPQPGCKISDQCVNGEWVMTCGASSASVE